MSEWHYNNPVEIHFGPGIIDNLPEFVESAFTPGRADNNIVKIDHQGLAGLIKLLF